jgi:hypothetical protein
VKKVCAVKNQIRIKGGTWNCSRINRLSYCIGPPRVPLWGVMYRGQERGEARLGSVYDSGSFLRTPIPKVTGGSWWNVRSRRNETGHVIDLPLLRLGSRGRLEVCGWSYRLCCKLQNPAPSRLFMRVTLDRRFLNHYLSARSDETSDNTETCNHPIGESRGYNLPFGSTNGGVVSVTTTHDCLGNGLESSAAPPGPEEINSLLWLKRYSRIDPRQLGYHLCHPRHKVARARSVVSSRRVP